MKILFVSGEFPPMQGGVGDYTREIGLALYHLGVEVHVATSTSAHSVPGLHVHPVIKTWNWGCWRSLLDLIRSHQPDVVHIQYQAAAYAMHPAINLLPRRLSWLGANRPRTAVTFHDLKVPYLFPKAGPLRRWIISELASQSDIAITTNLEDFTSLRQELLSAPAWIPIGSNITPELPAGYDRDAWRARWGAGPDDLLLCFFGFVNVQKGVDTLLHALSQLISDPEASVNPRLLLIGGQTGDSDPTNVAYLAKIQVLIAELDLGERVQATGYVSNEEVSASFAAVDLCILPFRGGVSFLHGTFHAALVHGVPIITTEPSTPLPELVHGGNVYLVPPNQPQALAEAITHLAAEPELRATLGAGAQVLSGQFRWEKIAEDTLEIYHNLCSNS